MDMSTLMEWIEHWEGRRNKTYIDTMGHPTVGIGFNLDAAGAQAAIDALGLNYDQVRAGTQILTDAQVNTLFQHSVDKAITGARSVVSHFDALPGDKQIVVVDMIFNLGVAGFSAFRNTIQAINKQDWAAAAQQMQESLWYKQVGARAKADCDLMAGRIAASAFA
jgi:GH24 family phage-related lysozyme (muramidase)